MPVRVVCPSCATQLNIKDEHAGRAVKCPKCAYVIPPSQAAAPIAPPGADMPQSPAVSAAPPNAGPPPIPVPSAPKPPKPISLDEPAPPPSRPVAKPASRSRDDDDDRQRRPKSRDRDDEDDRPAKRPSKKSRKDDDDKPKKGSSTPIILVVVGGLLLTCCGGVGYGIYYVVVKVQETAQDAKQWVENLADRVKYDSIKINMTRAEVEAKMGPGQIATADDVTNAFIANGYQVKDWTAKANEGRVLMWKSGKDTALACFHPDANGKLQAKAWETSTHMNTATDGWLDDQKYLEYRGTRPLPGVGGADPLAGPALDVTAEELVKDYRADSAAADAKYKDKVLVVEGKLYDITVRPFDVVVLLEGLPAEGDKKLGTHISCVVSTENARALWNLSRGQKIKMKGKGAEPFDPFVNVVDCTLHSQEVDPSQRVQIAAFIREFSDNSMTADAKYKDKQITLNGAVVESTGEAQLVLVASTKTAKAAGIKIKATWPFDARKQIESLKPGQRVTIKGEYTGYFDGTISIGRCWLVP